MIDLEKVKKQIGKKLYEITKIPIDHVDRQDIHCPLTPAHNCIGGRCIQFVLVELGKFGYCRWEISVIENLQHQNSSK